MLWDTAYHQELVCSLQQSSRLLIIVYVPVVIISGAEKKCCFNPVKPGTEAIVTLHLVVMGKKNQLPLGKQISGLQG